MSRRLIFACSSVIGTRGSNALLVSSVQGSVRNVHVPQDSRDESFVKLIELNFQQRTQSMALFEPDPRSYEEKT